jgi:hypothetical protein
MVLPFSGSPKYLVLPRALLMSCNNTLLQSDERERVLA